MNQTIERIRIQRERLAKLDKMIARGECFAAGISVEISVGANATETLDLDFGMISDMKGILEAMRQGIVDSIEWSKKQARSEADELNEFFHTDN